MSYERACLTADVPGDRAVAVEIGELTVAVARDGDEFFAIQDLCSHAAVALSEGEVIAADGSCQIECWLHGSTFDLRTGKPTVFPATEAVATFAVDVRDGEVYVDTSRPLNGIEPS
ncbi:MAG: non-heme iron oxygenase ferredoxin subunit [Nocardioides sp.]